MTTRERRLAKAERLRGWAGSRESKAEAAFSSVQTIADGIHFGQPILVGHHSEGGEHKWIVKVQPPAKKPRPLSKRSRLSYRG